MIYEGTPVSKGIAIGKVFLYEPFHAEVTEDYFSEERLEEQIARYKEALTKTEAELERIQAALETAPAGKAEIFGAHIEILHDDAMREEIMDCIVKERCLPDWAIWRIYGSYIKMLSEVDDPLIRERAADLQDVRNRLIRNWNNAGERNLSNLPEPVIVAAYDLLPSDTATIDRKNVMAVVTEAGGMTSHSAIIARSYDIPALLGVAGLMEKLRHGQEVIVDAMEGRLILNPCDDEMKYYSGKMDAHLADKEAEGKFIYVQPLMADGTRIDIGLNIGSSSPAALEGSKYTDLVGLFRTEFLYMEKPALPGEQEQFEAYEKVLKEYSPRPVTIRTLDVGGDKTLECMKMPHEDNPFLGNMALRLCFDKPNIFKTQIRALLRASVYGNLWLMLPMVGSIDDIRRAKSMIDDVRVELDREDIAYSPEVRIGIMVEIPSIALIAGIAAQEVDFASIGTNDLCQYLTATDRLNPYVSGYYQSYHPAMFRIIGHVVEEFDRAGKPICVCGEMGGDRLAVPVLVGLGLRKLSMGISSVARIKRVLSTLTMERVARLAEAVKNLPTAADVEAYLEKNIG
ncbi:MAG: phosphoenolpyruvate--protein phosphotransferase [Synergistaceae bacterium]|jgi:phosphotransferase system enzyme I (PtsI)|nr:phosphoenolpyruvate--protein phosphotransferase [Synergistaceae bacterium]